MTEGLKCLKFWTEYTHCGVLAWRKIYAKSARKMLQRKRLHHKKQISKGVLFKEYKTQTGSVTSAVKEMQLWISVMLLLAH